MSDERNDLPQDEATQHPEPTPPAETDSADEATASSPASDTESGHPETEAPRRSVLPILLSLLAVILAGLALAAPWLGPASGLYPATETDAPATTELQSALETTQSDLEQAAEQRQALQQSIDQLSQAQQQTQQRLGGELDNQRQQLRSQMQRLEQRVNRQEEQLLALRAELDKQTGQNSQRARWPLQEAQRLLRRGAADWALQPDAAQATLIIDQVLDLTEGRQATGLGALRERLEAQRAALQNWQQTHAASDSAWQDLAERLSALQPGTVDSGLPKAEADSDESAGWTDRLSSGLGRLVSIERDDRLEPELWDQQSRDSLTLLMQQSLLLAETAHRRGNDASAHVQRLATWLERLHGESPQAQAWLADLRQRIERPAPPSPDFRALSERLQRIRDAVESAS